MTQRGKDQLKLTEPRGEMTGTGSWVGAVTHLPEPEPGRNEWEQRVGVW